MKDKKHHALVFALSSRGPYRPTFVHVRTCARLSYHCSGRVLFLVCTFFLTVLWQFIAISRRNPSTGDARTAFSFPLRAQYRLARKSNDPRQVASAVVSNGSVRKNVRLISRPRRFDDDRVRGLV